MIFTSINTRKNDNYDNSGKQLAAKVSEKGYEVRTYDTRLEISGEGYHQKKDNLRDDEWSTKSELLDNPDYTDEFKILLDKEAVIRICQAAIKKKLIKMSDIIPQELESEIDKVEDELSGLFNKIRGY